MKINIHYKTFSENLNAFFPLNRSSFFYIKINRFDLTKLAWLIVHFLSTGMLQVVGNLRNLDLSSNKLRQLPPTIGSFRVLKTLNLSRNSLAHLPPEFQVSLFFIQIVGFVHFFATGEDSSQF